MTSELPAPLLAADVDCTDLDGFMLNVERLMASELVALSSHEVVAAALFLWCRAWKQRPAASLPDDDRVNAAFSKLSLARFKRLKEEVLRGFVKCSDGRLYHRVLAAEAVHAFERKQAFQKKRVADGDRLRSWRQDRKKKGAEWEQLRKAVFERDGNRCTKCASPDDLHCDHIIPAADGGASEMHNLATLCRSCHARKTALQRKGEMHFVAEGQGQGQGQGHIPLAKANGRAAPPSQDPWKRVYDRGKEVFGRSAGGVITNLRTHYEGRPNKVLAKIEDAAGARQPLEWINAFLLEHGRGEMHIDTGAII